MGRHVTKLRYEKYKEEIQADIVNILSEFGCQPILFVGSGLSRRYFNAPCWEGLLEHLISICDKIDRGLAYYKQRYSTLNGVGEVFAGIYQEWAWETGHNKFPSEMFERDTESQDYIKYKISEYLKSITPEKFNATKFKEEIASLTSIRPHAVITTNYDTMLESLFPEYEPIIGQQILRGQAFAVGEIYKIHGCVKFHESLVFTETDYGNFAKTKKFLSAKLLTFFNEHPLLFIGYSASDPNIQSILSDIDQALPDRGGIIPNVYILEWNEGIVDGIAPQREKVIATEDGRSVRVKLIEASDLSWVFDAFATTPSLSNVNPIILRALLARSYHFVRHDVSRLPVGVNFEMLIEGVSDSENCAKLFGIAPIPDYSMRSVTHPLSATDVGKKLDTKSWHITVKLINQIKDETGVNLKETDNKYHKSEKHNASIFRSYSHEFVELLKKIQNGEKYKLDI